MIKYFIASCVALLFGTMRLVAQDPAYDTAMLKTAKRISQEEWKAMLDKSQGTVSGYAAAAASETSDMAQKGVRVLKNNETVQLQTEVTAVFEGVVSGGQSEGGPTARSRYTFKLGPGQFTIQDGVIKRVP